MGRYIFLLACKLAVAGTLFSQTLLPSYVDNPEWTVRHELTQSGGPEYLYHRYYLDVEIDACGEVWQSLWEDNHYTLHDRQIGYFTQN